VSTRRAKSRDHSGVWGVGTMPKTASKVAVFSGVPTATQLLSVNRLQVAQRGNLVVRN
jgi:hypothetical protein